jgi:thymidylate kinase
MIKNVHSYLDIYKFEQPDAIIRLNCDFNERVKRIENRENSDFDDKTQIRNDRYRWITERIKENLVDVKWIDVNTTNKGIEDIYKEINEKLKDI